MCVSEAIVLLASTLLLEAVYVRWRLLMCLTMVLEVEAFRATSPEEKLPDVAAPACFVSDVTDDRIHCLHLYVSYRFAMTACYNRYFALSNYNYSIARTSGRQ